MSRFACSRLIRSRQPRRGLTLIELVVVLTILIALAGILIPLLPSMLSRSHTSTSATNLSEITKAVQTHFQLYGGYPDQCDSLTSSDGLFDSLPGGKKAPTPGDASTEMAGQLKADVLSIEEFNAARAAGITKVHLLQDSTGATAGWSPTFNPYADNGTPPTPTPITTSTKLAFIDNTKAAAVLQKLNLSSTGRYLVLGLGQRCTMVGKSIAEAPLHFGDTPALDPSAGYQRFVAIYLVSDTGANRTISQAVLVGINALHDDGFASQNDELQSWYDLGKGNN